MDFMLLFPLAGGTAIGIGVNMDWEKWGKVRETTFRELTPTSHKCEQNTTYHTRYHTL